MATKKTRAVITAESNLGLRASKLPAVVPSEDPCSGWFCPQCDHSRYCAVLHQRKVRGPESVVSTDDLQVVLDVVRDIAAGEVAQEASRRLRTVLNRREIRESVEARVRQLRLELSREK